MLNHGMYKNLFSPFLSIFKKHLFVFQLRNMSFIHKVSSVAMTGMSFKVLLLLSIYSTCAVNDVKLGKNIYQFMLRFELMMWKW